LLAEDGIQTIPFASLMDLIQAGDEGLERIRNLREPSRIPLNEVRLHAPIPADNLADGYAFETHVKTANANRGREVLRNGINFQRSILQIQ